MFHVIFHLNLLFRHYNSLESHVEDLPASYQIGSVLFETDDLKLALVQECKTWKRSFGSALNDKAGREQDQIFEFVDNLNKRMRYNDLA